MKGEFCYYFAYGSMCNPISLSKRGIQAVPPSLPATISGYDLQFSYGGMANLVADASSTVHGILHKVPMEQFKILCDIESGYDTVSVPATPYEPRTCSSKDPSNHDCQCGSSSVKNYDTSFTAQAFIIHPQRMAELKHLHPDEGNFLPSERYLLIITQGLQHFGADPGWIRRISSNPFKPTKTRDQCLTAEPASDPAQLPTWTQQQLAAYEGKVDDQKVTMACGLKVLEVDFSSNNAAPFIPTLRDRMSGRDFTFGICQALYDPRLPPLNSPEDVTEAHIVYAEDLTVEWVRLQGMTICQVGWLKTQDKQQDDMQTSQAG